MCLVYSFFSWESFTGDGAEKDSFFRIGIGSRETGEPSLEGGMVFSLQPSQRSLRMGREHLGVVEGKSRVHNASRLVAGRAVGGQDRPDGLLENYLGRRRGRGLRCRGQGNDSRGGGGSRLSGLRRGARGENEWTHEDERHSAKDRHRPMSPHVVDTDNPDLRSAMPGKSLLPRGPRPRNQLLGMGRRALAFGFPNESRLSERRRFNKESC